MLLNFNGTIELGRNEYDICLHNKPKLGRNRVREALVCDCARLLRLCVGCAGVWNQCPVAADHCCQVQKMVSEVAGKAERRLNLVSNKSVLDHESALVAYL